MEIDNSYPPSKNTVFAAITALGGYTAAGELIDSPKSTIFGWCNSTRSGKIDKRAWRDVLKAIEDSG